jgi:hypothetical protein
MKPRFLFLTMGLVATLSVIVVSCSPTTAPIADSVPQASVPTEASVPQSTATVEPTVAASTQIAEVQPIATSRGPNLEATDPVAVSLASGQLQLVEFFRFT